LLAGSGGMPAEPRVKRQRTMDRHLPPTRIDDNVEARLVTASERLDVSMSEVVRRALSLWLDATGDGAKDARS